MRPATGNEIGTAICEAVGIDPNTIHTIQLDLAVGDAARLTTIGFVDRFDIRQVMKHYTVVKRAGWAPPWPPPKLGDAYYKGGVMTDDSGVIRDYHGAFARESAGATLATSPGVTKEA